MCSRPYHWRCVVGQLTELNPDIVTTSTTTTTTTTTNTTRKRCGTCGASRQSESLSWRCNHDDYADCAGEYASISVNMSPLTAIAISTMQPSTTPTKTTSTTRPCPHSTEHRPNQIASRPRRPLQRVRSPSSTRETMVCRSNLTYHILAFSVILAANALGRPNGVAAAEASRSASGSPSAHSPSVRVFVVRHSDRQNAVEEAAALSLDLPHAAHPGVPSGQTNANNNNNTTGVQQHSLAALTLSQLAPATSAIDSSAPASEPIKRTQLGGPVQVNELNLPRLRPSWLNVSSRFKITGSSIEEIEFMMPAEYYLRQAFDAPVLLRTRLGIVEGVRSIKFNKHLYTFLGVPYAKPPVEGLRFKAPQPVESWAPAVLQATKWPPFCVQPSMTLASKSSPVHPLTQVMSEDCLYLNIWTPSLKFQRHHKRPVMVWIHGGAFQYGGISVDENDGSALALAGDVVVVTLNYRISAFGFLNANNAEHAPNNVGLLDQRLAMRWVQENIKQFGGDPLQVTLFGESAGGHSVGLHMISPGSQPFFKRAILQSGVPISYLRSYDVNPDNTGSIYSESISSVMMAKRLKCYTDVGEHEDNVLDSSAAAPAGTNGTATPIKDTPTATTKSTLDLDEDEAHADSNSSSSAGDDSARPTIPIDATILDDRTLACMREKSSLEILKAMGAPGNAGFFPTGNDQRGFFPNGPIMDSFDGENLQIGPQKDYLLGTNTDEGTFMLHYGMPNLFPARSPPRVTSVEQLKKSLQIEIERMSQEAVELERSERASNNSQAADLRSASGTQTGGAQAHLYRPLLKTSTSILEGFMPKSQVRVLENGTVTGNNSFWSKEIEFGKSVGSLITDIIFLCPARTLARTLAEAGRNVYFYLYSHRSSRTPYHEWIGVTHHDEVEFVFGRPLRLADVYSGADIEMSQRLIKIWSHFAHTGQALSQGHIEWPKYDVEDNNYMHLATGSASVGQRYHDRVCNVYDTVISVHLKD